MDFVIDRAWNGLPAEPGEAARVQLRQAGSDLLATVDAPYHGDPPPGAPAGSTERLWEYEVVEFFLVGSGGDYLEVELGPHGHYLALRLRGPRDVVERGLPIDYAAMIAGTRWSGRARLALALLPEGVERGNAFAIHGSRPRRYLAAHPTMGEQPDFHRIECFPRITL